MLDLILIALCVLVVVFAGIIFAREERPAAPPYRLRRIADGPRRSRIARARE